MTEPQNYQYFTVHIEADREHAAAERDMLGQYLTDDNAASTAKPSTEF
jgi:pyrroloquinoline-quinone synthase